MLTTPTCCRPPISSTLSTSLTKSSPPHRYIGFCHIRLAAKIFRIETQKQLQKQIQILEVSYRQIQIQPRSCTSKEMRAKLTRSDTWLRCPPFLRSFQGAIIFIFIFIAIMKILIIIISSSILERSLLITILIIIIILIIYSDMDLFLGARSQKQLTRWEFRSCAKVFVASPIAQLPDPIANAYQYRLKMLARSSVFACLYAHRYSHNSSSLRTSRCWKNCVRVTTATLTF